MKKLLFVIPLLFITTLAYPAWDETKPASSDIAANSQGDIQANFDALNDVFGDLISDGNAIDSSAT
ncbi:hypothetical protein LCGC14_3106470, partial [marine sediment metagenome]